MGRRRRILIVAGCVVALVLAWIGWPLFSREPRYGGRTLSSWLRQLDDGDHLNQINWSTREAPSSPGQKEGADAIRHMGTNTLPVLLQWITNRDSRLVVNLNAYLERRNWKVAGITLRQRNGEPNFGMGTRIRRHQAALAFEALGPMARSAVPQLEEALTNDSETTREASIALAGVGPDGYLALTRAVANLRTPGDWAEFCAVWALTTHHASAPGMVDALMGAITNGSTPAEISCWALGELKQEPQRVVPFLAATLRSRDVGTRCRAAESLENFGTNASSAVPALIQALNDSDSNVRDQAARALKAIDPAVAADVKAKVK